MIYIDTYESLEKANTHFAACPVLGVDFECENNLHHYGSFLCLIQVSDGKESWIIDVIALKDISGFLKILENPEILKIFHDVNFDYRILHNQYNSHPKNTFDTKIVCDILNKEKKSLDYLIRVYFNAEINFSGQKSDWTKRPISKELLEYAAFDVQFLLPLRMKLLDELKEKNLLEEAQSQFRAIDTKEFTTARTSYYSLPGYKRLSPEVQKRAKALYLLREETAKSLDKPVYMILHNKRLIELALNPPKTFAEWQRLRATHPIVKSEKWFVTCR